MTTLAKGRNAVVAMVSRREGRAFGAGQHDVSSVWSIGWRRACRPAGADCDGGCRWGTERSYVASRSASAGAQRKEISWPSNPPILSYSTYSRR